MFSYEMRSARLKVDYDIFSITQMWISLGYLSFTTLPSQWQILYTTNEYHLHAIESGEKNLILTSGHAGLQDSVLKFQYIGYLIRHMKITY